MFARKRHLGLILALLATIPILAFGLTPKVSSVEGPRVVLHLASASFEPGTAAMVLQRGASLAERGAHVTLLLELGAIELAAAAAPEIEGAFPAALSRALQRFLDAGGRVLLCASCAQASGIDVATLPHGIQLGDDDTFAHKLLAADKVLTF